MRYLFSLLLLALILTTSCSRQQHASSSFISYAEKPPMGWNSFDSYYGAITETQFKKAVDVLSNKLLPFGWNYAVVDYCWFNPGPQGWDTAHWETFSLHQKQTADGLSPVLTMDDYGRLLPSLNRFPSSKNNIGFAEIADYVHKKGMKFGIHIMRGIPRQAVIKNTPILGTKYTAKDIAEPWDTCTWLNVMYGVDSQKPGAQEYYNSLFNLYASWGVDFVKADDMTVPVYHKGEIEVMRKAIDQCGRAMVLSLSCGETPIPQALHLEKNANMYRISIDFWDRWKDLRHNFDLLNSWSPFIGEGTWPDADMIPLGKLCLSGYPESHTNPLNTKKEHDCNLTPNEQKTLVTLWCIARSPLIWGGDPLTSSEETFKLLSNKEILAVNQNSCDNHQIHYEYTADSKNDRIWFANIPNSNEKYVAFFNLKDSINEISFTMEWENLRGKYNVRNLWEQKDIGIKEGAFKITLDAHASALFKLTPVKP